MSYQVKTHIERPLEWIDDYDVWCCISDYTDSCLYSHLDAIFRILVDGADSSYYADFKDMTKNQLKEVYNNTFPLLLANFFENLAKDIKSGELEIETLFE